MKTTTRFSFSNLALLVMGAAALWWLYPREPRPVALVAPIATPTGTTTLAAPFELLDPGEMVVTVDKGIVSARFMGGIDPYIPNYQILASVLWHHRKAREIRLHRTLALGGSNETGKLRYDRRRKSLSYYEMRSMAGPGVLSESRTICRNVTDATVFRAAALKQKRADISALGCPCRKTDLRKNK